MSIPLLAQASQELRRLAIAGAPLSKDDFRVKRLIDPLKQSGERAPVFGKVAQLLEALINSNANDAAAKLLKSITLVNAILYTQGQIGCSGERKDLPDSPLTFDETAVSARLIKPVIEALTTVGSGRWEIVNNAWERGLFSDPRLIDVSIAALNDHYGELAEFMASTVVPSFGPSAVPLLKDGLDFKGDRWHSRRLQAIGKISGMEDWDYYHQAIEEGNAHIRVAAVQCLADFTEAISTLKELTEDKSIEVRSAALEALSKHDDGDASELLLKAIKSKDLFRAIGPAKRCNDAVFLDGLIQETKQELEKCKSEKKKPNLERLHGLIQCFENRNDNDSIELLHDIVKDFKSIQKLESSNYNSGVNLLEICSSYLIQLEHKASLQTIAEMRDECDYALLDVVCRAAFKLMSGKEFYKIFHPIVISSAKGSKKRAKETLSSICNLQFSRYHYHYHIYEENSDERHSSASQWDNKWLDFAVEHKQLNMAVFLARPKHKKAISFFTEQIEHKDQENVLAAMYGLLNCQVKNFEDLYCKQLQRIAKGVKRWWYYSHQFLNIMKHLPNSAIPKIESIAVDFPDSFAHEVVDILQDIREAEAATKKGTK